MSFPKIFSRCIEDFVFSCKKSTKDPFAERYFFLLRRVSIGVKISAIVC
jgi:hypothetical protein